MHCELCAAMGAHTCGARQRCTLVTFETLITILTIETLNLWQFLLPDNKEWQWIAFAILAMFFSNCSVTIVFLLGWLLSTYLYSQKLIPVSYTHLTLPTTPYV